MIMKISNSYDIFCPKLIQFEPKTLLYYFIFAEPACSERDSCYNLSLVYVRCACIVRVSFWICPGHNLYICAWISKLFGANATGVEVLFETFVQVG